MAIQEATPVALAAAERATLTGGVDIGKNGFHLVALDRNGTVVQRQGSPARVSSSSLRSHDRRWSAWKPAQARNGWRAS